jgi:hypothetical protein
VATAEQGVMKISNHGRNNPQGGRSPRRALAALLATVALLLVPASALAQSVSPTSDQYDPKTSIVSEGPGGPGSTPSTDRAAGGLPFTGLDVGLLIGAAALLGGSGLVLRRVLASDRQ